MRLGIYGGTFDPIHLGHLILAEQCREQCQLDEVWFMPASMPPHKQQIAISPARFRTEMIEFAIAGHPAFRVSRMELSRQGPSFTVTTLEELHGADPTRELFLLIGADSLQDFPRWREPKRILELATLVAVNRGDHPLPDLSELNSVCGELATSRLQFVSMPGIDLSATDVRRRVRGQQSIRYLVPRAVEAYLHQHRLYHDNETASGQ